MNGGEERPCCKKLVCFECMFRIAVSGTALRCPHCRNTLPELSQDDRTGAYLKARHEKKAKCIAKVRARVRRGKGTGAEKRAVAGLVKVENDKKTARKKRGDAKAFQRKLKQLGIQLLRKYPDLPQKPHLVVTSFKYVGDMNHDILDEKEREARKRVAIAGGYNPQQPSYAL